MTYSEVAVLNQFNNGQWFYCDSICDEASEAQIPLMVPAFIRNQLQPNEPVAVSNIISKRVVNNASRIDIRCKITYLVVQALINNILRMLI